MSYYPGSPLINPTWWHCRWGSCSRTRSPRTCLRRRRCVCRCSPSGRSRRARSSTTATPEMGFLNILHLFHTTFQPKKEKCGTIYLMLPPHLTWCETNELCLKKPSQVGLAVQGHAVTLQQDGILVGAGVHLCREMMHLVWFKTQSQMALHGDSGFYCLFTGLRYVFCAIMKIVNVSMLQTCSKRMKRNEMRQRKTTKFCSLLLSGRKVIRLSLTLNKA